ncbi:MAG: hypothetical protein JWR53_1852 [Glaciihabitans sp.]|nr:hypothetical protein [Glaciihabitans sp.]
MNITRRLRPREWQLSVSRPIAEDDTPRERRETACGRRVILRGGGGQMPKRTM